MDTNMRTALRWANALGPVPYGWLESTINNPAHVATIVLAFNDTFVDGTLLSTLNKAQRLERMQVMTVIGRRYIYDREWRKNGQSAVLVSILLRLWSGCICGAKTIALGTRDGPNTEQVRARQMAKLKKMSKNDYIFKAGVRASLDFKRLLLQPVSFVGIADKDILEYWL
jgi:hypothetical protein